MSVYTRYCFSVAWRECAFIGCEMHSLWLRCPHGRSGQWKRAGLPVAERVLSAELGGEINPPEYRCLINSAGRFLICSLSFYFWIIFRKKLGGGFLDRGGKNLVSDCLQLPPSTSSSAVETTQIDLFLHSFKNPNASYVKAVY